MLITPKNTEEDFKEKLRSLLVTFVQSWSSMAVQDWDLPWRQVGESASESAVQTAGGGDLAGSEELEDKGAWTGP